MGLHSECLIRFSKEVDGARRRRKAARSRDFPAGSNLCRGLAHSFAEKK